MHTVKSSPGNKKCLEGDNRYGFNQGAKMTTAKYGFAQSASNSQSIPSPSTHPECRTAGITKSVEIQMMPKASKVPLYSGTASRII
jgi:hypothetical protein